MSRRLVTVAPENFAAEAARLIRRYLDEALEERRRASIMLSGGSTPQEVYRLFGEEAVGEMPYDAIDFFFGDERWVPPQAEDSNAGTALRLWLIKRHVPPSRFHPFFGETPEAARKAVEAALRDLPEASASRWPRVDLTLLGLGEDGHVASLFPGIEALREEEALTVETLSPKPPPRRLSMTLPVLNASRRVLFLVKGTGKSEVLQRLMADAPDLVASRVRGPEVEVLADLEAAAGIRLA